MLILSSKGVYYIRKVGHQYCVQSVAREALERVPGVRDEEIYVVSGSLYPWAVDMLPSGARHLLAALYAWIDDDFVDLGLAMAFASVVATFREGGEEA